LGTLGGSEGGGLMKLCGSGVLAMFSNGIKKKHK